MAGQDKNVPTTLYGSRKTVAELEDELTGGGKVPDVSQAAAGATKAAPPAKAPAVSPSARKGLMDAQKRNQAARRGIGQAKRGY